MQILATILMILFLVSGILLMLMVLLQRGRGGGLAGAFGGPGGHSAFGTKTADVFTKITAGLGVAFFVLAIVAAYIMQAAAQSPEIVPGQPPAQAPIEVPQTGEPGTPPPESSALTPEPAAVPETPEPAAPAPAAPAPAAPAPAAPEAPASSTGAGDAGQ